MSGFHATKNASESASLFLSFIFYMTFFLVEVMTQETTLQQSSPLKEQQKVTSCISDRVRTDCTTSHSLVTVGCYSMPNDIGGH